MDSTLIAGLIGAAAAIVAAVVQRWRRRPKTPLASSKSSITVAPERLAVGATSAALNLTPAIASTVWTDLSREAAYTAGSTGSQRVNAEQKGTKHVLLAALHGHSGDRLVSRARPIPEFSACDASLVQCVRSVGPGLGIVREFYNIPAEDRRDEMLEWLMRTKDEDGYAVSAFCMPATRSHLAPLLVGARDVLLGLEDPRYYRIQGVLHPQDEGAVQRVTRYFESLWHDPRHVVLRSAVRIEESGIERIRGMIRGRKA